ncbi:MAG: hypothetical protein QOE61_2255 [Micromonosporaceae bacterium]|nr:hypothetical protein [Micromonosporaceae bacterium]
MIDPVEIQNALGEVPRVVGLAAAGAAAITIIWAVVQVARYAAADRFGRAVLRKRWLIRATWTRTARRVGLVMAERVTPPWWRTTPHPARSGPVRELVPAMRTGVREWGVTVDVRAVGRLGLAEFENASRYLAGAWRVPIVRPEQLRPGVVRLRALLRDPLTQPLPWRQPATTAGAGAGGVDPGVWRAGVDADREPVTLRSSGVRCGRRGARGLRQDGVP